MRPIKTNKGLTLVELVCSIAIIGIMVLVFYSVFLSNWGAMENYSTRAYLWQEMDMIVDQVTLDAREATSINVSVDQKSATFLDNSGTVFAVYNLRDNGFCEATRNGVLTTFTERLNFAQSTFAKSGKSLLVNLTLTDQVFDRGVSIDTSTEIYPRN